MIFRIIFTILIINLSACGDSDDESHLVDLTTTASQDIIAINFPADIETTVSINSLVNFNLQGLRSNGVDTVTISKDIQWSLSDGSNSSIDKKGLLMAGNTAEIITLTAKFGILSESIQINVSSAKFDQVVQLHDQTFSINMCQSQAIKPIGRYVDDNGDEEIRTVDSTIINTIEWIISNSEDGSSSQRATIETSSNQATLHTLEAGDIIIQAQAPSVFSGNVVTSIDFNQTLSNGLNTIKLCLASDSDLTNCNATSLRVEKDKMLSLIAVGNYQTTSGSSVNENISRNSKWGKSNDLNASILFSADRQQLEITGETEESSATLSVACGKIDQSVDGIDLSQGVILAKPVSCSNIDCVDTSTFINIDKLSVESFEVSANDIDLTDDESITLSQRPNEINLVVKANFSNNSQQTITNDGGLVYTIIDFANQSDVIEKILGSPGDFNVLNPGTAKIQLDFRNETFIVVIEVP